LRSQSQQDGSFNLNRKINNKTTSDSSLTFSKWLGNTLEYKGQGVSRHLQTTFNHLSNAIHIKGYFLLTIPSKQELLTLLTWFGLVLTFLTGIAIAKINVKVFS
tara:strand:- start:1770 stop:2081 length:312 start_codon:yes stop_codon:yes gene_type:complete